MKIQANKTEVVRARITPQLKHDVELVLEKLGLSVSEAIGLTMAQIKLQQGLPFDVKIPNALTQLVFKETDSGKNLIKPRIQKRCLKIWIFKE